MSAKDLLTAALDYAARGLPVFPCNPENKRPLLRADKDKDGKEISGTGGFHKATTDAGLITSWWKKWPKAYIGMPTGQPSGIAVLDLDVKEGKNGLAAVPDWETRSPVIVTTRSGGKHLYFRFDGSIQSKTDTLAPGVDTRGAGGYVIVPPSSGYAWVSSHDLTALPPWPDDLRAKPREREAPANDNASDEPEMPVIDAALKAIPADCDYTTWWEVGCALYSALGDEVGFKYFDRWSSTSPEKYRPQECAKQWEACCSSKEFNIGTLYHHANNASPNWRAGIAWPRLIQSSADFIAGFIPPDYLVDGLLQRRYLYSMTAPTGTGKTAIAMRLAIHVALGLPLAGLAVEKGKVLMLAGENPDDVRSRWIKLCEEMKVEPNAVDVCFIPGVVPLSNKQLRQRIEREAKDHGPYALVIVDTSAAFFQGKEENNNV
jgi:hypothetical protein